MTITERPGVYTAYEISGVRYSGPAAAKTVGVAAVAASGTKGQIYDITSYAAAAAIFGAGCPIAELIRLLILNGVSVIKAVPIFISGVGEASTADYAGGFAALACIENVNIVICDSAEGDVHSAFKSEVMTADERYGHRLGIFECDGGVSEGIAAAAAINSERVILTLSAPDTVTGGVAAAVAGAIASQLDPAIPLNGARLYGLDKLSAKYSDGDISLLVQGGVTPVENFGGTVSIVRGITTRTLTMGSADNTWREISTVLIVDNVIPTVRDSLTRMFSRTKNTVQTRGAIRTQVIIELEKKLAAEIIDGYSNVTVVQSNEDPTVCEVSFEFTVTHGLNRIQLVAYITV